MLCIRAWVQAALVSGGDKRRLREGSGLCMSPGHVPGLDRVLSSDPASLLCFVSVVGYSAGALSHWLVSCLLLPVQVLHSCEGPHSFIGGVSDISSCCLA